MNIDGPHDCDPELERLLLEEEEIEKQLQEGNEMVRALHKEGVDFRRRSKAVMRHVVSWDDEVAPDESDPESEALCIVEMSLGLVLPLMRSEDGSFIWRWTPLLRLIETLSSGFDDPQAIELLVDVLEADVPIGDIRRDLEAFALRFGVPYESTQACFDEALTVDDAIDVSLQRMARAGLVEFDYSFDDYGRPNWNFTELFMMLDDPAFGHVRSSYDYRRAVVHVDDPAQREDILRKGLTLAWDARVPWKGLTP